MIIQNNFNDKSANPLNSYHGIGKGRNSQNYEMKQEQNNFIKKNLDNRVIQDVIDKDSEFDDNDQGDKWDFFR